MAASAQTVAAAPFSSDRWLFYAGKAPSAASAGCFSGVLESRGRGRPRRRKGGDLEMGFVGFRWGCRRKEDKEISENLGQYVKEEESSMIEEVKISNWGKLK